MKAIAGFIICLGLLAFQCNRDDDEPNTKPAAKFSISGYELPIPNPISFINISANATSYEWNFGDNTFSTQSNPSHVYASRGTYNVKLKVTGPAGSDSTCKILTVESAPPANTSAFSYYQEKCAGTPLGISFKTVNPASTDPVWNIEGHNYLERDLNYQFLVPADYTIKYSTRFGSIRDTVVRIIRID